MPNRVPGLLQETKEEWDEVRRLHVIGRKNSGKTTLVCDLITYWARQGIRVGSVKHTHHRHELDVPGKDSFLHRQAGASPVAILSPGMTAIFQPNPTGEPAAGYSFISAAFAGCDLVLVEGQSQADAPKIEVWRAELAVEPMAKEDPSIHALVSDDPVPLQITCWRRSDLPALAERLLELAKQSLGDEPATPRSQG